MITGPAPISLDPSSQRERFPKPKSESNRLLHPNRDPDAIAADVGVEICFASIVQDGELLALGGEDDGDRNCAEDANEKPGRSWAVSNMCQSNDPDERAEISSTPPSFSFPFPPLFFGGRSTWSGFCRGWLARGYKHIFFFGLLSLLRVPLYLCCLNVVQC